MYDSELVVEILRQIYQAAQTILERFQPVKTVSDFTISADDIVAKYETRVIW